MRRLLSLLSLLVAASLITVPLAAHAQAKRDNDDARRQQEQEEAAKKKQKDKDWQVGGAPLPKVKNSGPCPFVKVLYDASRYVELKDDRESASAVAYSGEIEGVRAVCEYRGTEPIKVSMMVDFGFGRGPQSTGPSKDFRYWVAVTTRNHAVLAKQDLGVRVNFPAGTDRVMLTDPIQQIVIPRANAGVSGANFEVLVGFDVTPQMAAFNRLGKRFKVNASGATETASAAGTTASQ